jgi:hypothetical protein
MMSPELIDTVKRIRNLDILKDSYLDKIHNDVVCVIYDNEYAECSAKQIEILIRALFEDMAEDILWFLHEFTPGKSSGPHVVLPGGKEYTFKSDEDYYSYLKDN